MKISLERILLVLSLIAIVWQYVAYNDARTAMTGSVRTTYVDTIPFYNPVPRDSMVIRYVTQRLPVAGDKEENLPDIGSNDERNVPQNGNIVAGNIPDSADVVIPITQKVYEDSTYTAYVSGYRARLDSFAIRQKREIVTVTKWKPRKRWSIGLQAGYGATRNGMEPYIGIGISYNLFSF